MPAYPVSPRDAHINAALSNFASRYVNSQFLADMLSPTLLVGKESDSFWKRLRVDEATIYNDLVGPRSKINEVTYHLESDSYSTKGRGLSHPVPESLVLNADQPLSPKELGMQTVMQAIKLAREKRVADQIMTAANWASANTSAITNNWDDETNGTPVTDLKLGLRAIPFNGEDVNVFGVCSDVVADALSLHPQVMGLRAGGGTDGGPVGMDELAKHLKVAGILTSKIHYNTATLDATASYSRLWGTTTFAWVVVPKVAFSTEQMAFSLTFRHNLPGSAQGVRAREWYDPTQGIGGTDFVAAELKDDEKVIQNDAGYLFTSVL